ncbi:MAG: MnmC family methyltransferase [Parasphingorhabdus sp.]|uniref:spermine/spermidine synthase domain-containing protein n=1 Tax=Parasphingorhabdus sp. TaxID=2709688 RepID=UPI003298D3AD
MTRELLGRAPIDAGNNSGNELRLFRRALKNGDEYSIMLGGIELMNSRLSGSEEALATLSCARIATAHSRILIGGYGMGFTLRAAQRALPETAEIVVAELLPAIMEWAGGPMAQLTANCLDDPRVKIVLGDVKTNIATDQNHYDAILLDVDNGPDGLTKNDNDHLYSNAGLHAAKLALRNGGILAIWSSAGDPAFTRRLQQNGFAVEEHPISARANGKGARHMIWLARC